MNENANTPEEAKIAFERARLDYCVSAFKMQQDDADILERRAKFFVPFATVFLGAIFFKLDFLKDLLSAPGDKKIPVWLTIMVVASLFLLGLSLVAALLALSVSMRLRRSQNPYPHDIVDSLFAPDSDYLDECDEPSLLRKIALNYAIALKANANINKRKARYIGVAFVFVACAIALSFSYIFLILTCLSLVLT